MILSCIAAVAENGVIGKDNELPWRLSEDLKRFKKLTVGHAVIMGRKTFESIGRPLPNRTSIVITRGAEYEAAGAVVVHSIEEAIRQARRTEQTAEGAREAFVIGGEAIFREALPWCARLYLTRVHTEAAGDVRFPSGDGIRVDAAIESGDEVSPYYDPLIAKLVVWGGDRDTAVQRLTEALAAVEIDGVTHNLPLLQRIVAAPAFVAGNYDVYFLESLLG